MFENLIGQQTVKNQLEFFIDSFKQTAIFPHALLVAPKGVGKSAFAEETGKNLIMPHAVSPKPFITVNGTAIQNLEQFIQIILQTREMAEQEGVTYFLDEVHKMPVKVMTALLTILNPNKDNRNTFLWGEEKLVFDFRKMSFILATTDPQEVIDPLKDRCNQIHFERYSMSEMGQIIQMYLATNIKIGKELLNQIATTCRGNARGAFCLTQYKINKYCETNKIHNFTLKHWNQMCQLFGILPLGLSQTELQILNAVAENNGKATLTALAALTAMPRDAIMGDLELHLLRHKLMTIGARGREINGKGRDYLAQVKKDFPQLLLTN